MCHTGKVFLLLIFALLGCSSPKSATKPEDVYRFTERPYDVVQVADRELYNYVFNVIRNKLVFYVLENNPIPRNRSVLFLSLTEHKQKEGSKNSETPLLFEDGFSLLGTPFPSMRGFLLPTAIKPSPILTAISPRLSFG